MSDSETLPPPTHSPMAAERLCAASGIYDITWAQAVLDALLLRAMVLVDLRDNQVLTSDQ